VREERDGGEGRGKERVTEERERQEMEGQ